jgi:hypothetical protein
VEIAKVQTNITAMEWSEICPGNGECLFTDVAKVYSSIKSAMPEIEAPEIMLIFNQKADFTALPDVMMYISSGQDARTTRVS